MLQAEPEFCEAHRKGFSIHIRKSVFPVGTQAFGDVILMPGKDANGFTDRNQFQAQFHLAAEPDMVAHHAILCGVGAALPDLAPKEEGTTLDGHMPIRVDGAGYGDLVEEVEEVQLAIQHDGGAEDGIGPGLLQLGQGVG